MTPLSPYEENMLKQISHALSMTKNKSERDEGLQLLEDVPMTFKLLHYSMAGQKICRVFRSSRYFDRALALHQKWLALADNELSTNWNELKHAFLSNRQISQLNRAQAAYEKYIPDQSRWDSHSTSTADPSSLRDLDNLPSLNENSESWSFVSDGLPRTPVIHDTDDSLGDSLFEPDPDYKISYSSITKPITERRGRPRGRPRKHPLPTSASFSSPGNGLPRGSTSSRGRRVKPVNFDW